MDQLPRERVARAIEEARAEDGTRGSVMKVLYLDEQGEKVGDWASQQLPEDPFSGQTIAGLREPPYPLAQLVHLAEMHPVHGAALEQKTADICGKGWEWQAEDEDDADDKQKDELVTWFNSLAPDELDMREVVEAAWLDQETTGWGLLELARDTQGVCRRIHHVPSHTVRAHRDGFRLCQIREERRVWFRRWGSPEMGGAKVRVDSRSGSLKKIQEEANDLFVIKKPSRRSTWYGIPGYISSIGWITLALAARDDNLMFFANRREPRWAIILTNLSENADLEDDLRRAFTVDLRQPYRNIIVPITGPGNVNFQKLGESKQEGSFDRLSERADKAIMIAHRVPAERLANASVGPLGGTATVEASRIYKEGVVGPGQELLQTRLNKLVEVEWPIAQAGGLDAQKRKLRKDADAPDERPEELPTWKIVMDDLDLSSDREDLEQTVLAYKSNLVNLREARHRIGLAPLMRKVQPEAPEPPPFQEVPDEPVLDPITGDPVLDEVTGEPKMKPGTQPPPPPKPEPVSPEELTEEEESPYNELLFCELPGSSTGPEVALAAPIEGIPEITKHREDGLQGAVRELLVTARENGDRIAELTAAAAEG